MKKNSLNKQSDSFQETDLPDGENQRVSLDHFALAEDTEVPSGVFLHVQLTNLRDKLASRKAHSDAEIETVTRNKAISWYFHKRQPSQ